MRLARAQARFLERVTAPTRCADPGLEVYRRNLRANWRRALAAAYPVCERLVGAAFFDECAARYAMAHPARSGDLNAHGEAFPAFVAAYPHAAGVPYLPDVARLEWAVHLAAHAADPRPFDAAALAAVPHDLWPSLRLAPQAGSAWVESEHPVVSIWEANQPSRDGSLDGAWRPEAAVVWREGTRVRVHRAGRDAPLLRQLFAGAPLGQACLDAEDAAAVPRWVAAGLFAGHAP